jgi:hypothetical protein
MSDQPNADLANELKSELGISLMPFGKRVIEDDIVTGA